jgi:hypothetical protein
MGAGGISPRSLDSYRQSNTLPDGYRVSATRREQWGPADPIIPPPQGGPYQGQQAYPPQGPPPQRDQPQGRPDYDRSFQTQGMGPPTSTYNEFTAPQENYSYTQAQVAYPVQQGSGPQTQQPNQAQPRTFTSSSSPYQGDGRGAQSGYGIGRAQQTYYGDSSGQSMSTTPIQQPSQQQQQQQQAQYPTQRLDHVQDPYYGGRGAYIYRPFLPIPSQ